MFGDQLDTLDQTMREVYKSGYYRTAYEIQRGVGVGWDFATLDDKTISKVINKPWAADGANFSSRVWGNRQKLVNELNQTLTQNIVLGQDPQKAIDAIAKKMNTSKANAGRLVMTEEAFFSSAAQKDCFNELDVEEFEIVATLDSHTSEICQDMDGKHFPMSQWEVGVTAPPFHVHCRTTTVPYFEDDFGSVGERAARGEDGKTYHVPADMTYKQWKEKFVDGGDKSGLNEVEPDDTIKGANNTTAPQASQASMGTLGDQNQLGQNHAAAMQQIVENAPDEVRETWNNYVDRLNVVDAKSGGKAFCSYTKGITIDIDKVSQGQKAPVLDAQGNIQWVQAKKPYYTAFHEFGHNISSLMAQDETGSMFSDIADVYRSKKFLKPGQPIGYTLTEMMKAEGDDYFDSIFQQMRADARAAGQRATTVRKIDAWRKLRDEIRSKPIEACTDISDMFDGVSNGNCLAHYGHTNQDRNYWKKVSLGTEGFAEMFSATMMNPDSVDQIKHYFPKSYDLFLEILQEKGVNIP
jgi:SPP1 gp7 family putative phage head morphogenesis protein